MPTVEMATVERPGVDPPGEARPGSTSGLDVWLDRRRTVFFAALAFVVAGLAAASRLPLEWVPTVELPRVTINATWPGAAPLSVERRVTLPIERALEGLPGLGEIRSYSRPSQSHLSIELLPGHRPSVALGEISDRLTTLRSVLPDGVEPRLDRQIPEDLRDEIGFMTLQITGPVDPVVLRRLAEEEIGPRLRALPGIADLSLEGGRTQEVQILLDGERLESHGLTPGTVRDTLAEALGEQTFGRLREGPRSTLLFQTAVDTLQTLRRLPLLWTDGDGVVRLEDVAHLGLDAAPAVSLGRIDGRPVVGLVLERTPDSNLLATASRVRETLDTFEGRLPPGVEVRLADDRSGPVRDNLEQLLVSALAGGVLILVVLGWMLPASRLVPVVVLSVVVSLACALGVMGPLGLSLNLLTLAGLAMVVGLLVDNAVVVAERLAREERRVSAAEAIRRTWRAVALPLVGGTVTTLAVLAPLVWVSGELRALFASFAVLTALTLACSLVAALGLVPLVATRPRSPTAELPTRRATPRRVGLHRRLRPVDGALGVASRWPLAALVVLFLALGVPIQSLPEPMEEPARGWSPWQQQVAERYNATLGSDGFRSARRYLDPLLGGVVGPFFDKVHLGPRWSFGERPELRLRLALPAGSGLERTDDLIAQLESRALASPAVSQTLVRVFEDRALMRVQFGGRALADPEPLRLRQELITLALQWSDVDLSLSGLVPQGFQSGLGEVASFVILAHGPSWQALEAPTAELAQRLRQDFRVVDVDTAAGPRGRHRGRESLALTWSADAQARTGSDARTLADALRLRLWNEGGSLEADLVETGRPVPVRLQLAGSETWTLDELLEAPLEGAVGAFRLAGNARLERQRQPPTIERRSQQVRRMLRVYYRGPKSQGEDWIDATLADFVPPAGQRFERPEGTFLDRGVQHQLALLLGATVLAVFLVLAAVFESWRLPWLVLVSLPLAFVGVALGFVWTGADFAEGAFIGLVLLTGIAVNDGILLVDRYRRLRQRRPDHDPGRLAHLAARQRLRPMWTTTATSIAGVAPLLLIAGAGDFWLGFAVTVAGGLLSSTLLAPPAIVALCASQRRRPLPRRPLGRQPTTRQPSARRQLERLLDRVRRPVPTAQSLAE